MVEQLDVAGVGKNRRLARALADAALAEIRRQLKYKCAWRGAALVEAPPFDPSSKRCSRCGAVKPSLPLSQRMFRSDECGLVLDRDATRHEISRPLWPPSPGVARRWKTPVDGM